MADDSKIVNLWPPSPERLALEERLLLRRLAEIQNDRRRPRGRPPNDDAPYVELLRIWEAYRADRPNVRIKALVHDLQRSGIPGRLGLKIGTGRTDKSHTAFVDALARGRWARNRMVLDRSRRRSQGSLLGCSQPAPQTVSFLGLGLVRIELKVPARLRKRKKIRSD